MHYQIRKGWPSEAALDELFPLEAGADIDTLEGKVLKVGETGIAKEAESIAAGDIYGFCFAAEDVNKKAALLMSDAIIEVDSTLYEAGTYTVGTAVGVKNGKFDSASATYAVARVINYDAISGKLRLMWFSVK